MARHTHAGRPLAEVTGAAALRDLAAAELHHVLLHPSSERTEPAWLERARALEADIEVRRPTADPHPPPGSPQWLARIRRLEADLAARTTHSTHADREHR